MSGRLALMNVVAFGLQAAIVIAVGAALARTLRIDDPKAMLAYWRALLVACLLLPVFQPWHVVIPPALTTPAAIAPAEHAVETTAFSAPAVSSTVARPIADLVLFALAGGIAVRAFWLTIGAYGLRRLRRGAAPFDPLPESVLRAQELVGTRAGVYISHHVSGPITFGVLRPVVVFPPSVCAMPAHIQEAIACHELLHVRRRDWLHEMLEEVVRTMLWFHPAIWWLIGRIRLVREQVVDQGAIRAIDSKERYIEALLAVAIASSPVAFVPASSFLRRHLLKKRVARILQETAMSTRRLIASFTVSAAVLAAAATLAVRSFPLEAQGQAPADTGRPVQLVSGGEHLLHGQLPDYPKRAVERRIAGDVVVELSLNERGEVSDARVVSGPDELRKAALEAVLQWHFSPATMSSTATQATLRFRVPEVEIVDVHGTLRAEDAKLHAKQLELKVGPQEVPIDYKLTYNVAIKGDSKLAGKQWNLVELKAKQTFDGTSRLLAVHTERVPDAVAKEVLAQAGVVIGDVITEESAARLAKTATAMDEHFLVRFHHDRKGGVILTILAH